ncbi:MAG: hypothetical protein ACR2F1_15040 [Nitrososphaeraceae archaeon]
MTNNKDYEYIDSIYTSEEYEQLTGGKYGKEIFVPYNSNHIQDNNNIIINEQELKSNIHSNNFIEYVIEKIKKTVKYEDVLIRQILYTGLSSYIGDDPINLGILAPTSEGKTYPVEECMKLFPKEDVYKVGSMSTKVLVRQRGILIDKNGKPIDQNIKELIKKKNLLDDKKESKEEKLNIQEEIQELFEDAKTLIDLRGKILVFLEPPQKEVWEILKPILSHDSFEIEFPFVNQTDREGHQTKNVVVRGWPSCIFCSAKDESNWPIWPEIKSRFLITSPNMILQKYQESTKLISSKYGLPNVIQQQIIISDNEIELASNCILLIKQKITELRSKNQNGTISLWIPYKDLLEAELPSNKGTDVRLQKRIFSLLRIVPIIKFNLRKLLILEGETCVIADLEDMKEVLSITHNFDGIPKFKIEFFNEIFYPCYSEKTEVDSSKDGKRNEEIIAVTTRQLCDYFKQKRGKPISTDNLKKVYLNELINNAIIDYTDSKIHGRQDIYYPLTEPFENNSKNESLSFSSNSTLFDKVSQQILKIYEKITNNINETWLFYELIKSLSHRIDLAKIEATLFVNHLNNHKQFQLLDDNNERMTIREFTKSYTEKPLSQFDNKRSPIMTLLDNLTPFWSNLARFDKKDENYNKEFLMINHLEKVEERATTVSSISNEEL